MVRPSKIDAKEPRQILDVADAVLKDIAAEVGVSPRTFNNYFSSKGEAIAARHLERARSIAAGLRAEPAAKPLWEDRKSGCGRPSPARC